MVTADGGAWVALVKEIFAADARGAGDVSSARQAVEKDVRATASPRRKQQRVAVCE